MATDRQTLLLNEILDRVKTTEKILGIYNVVPSKGYDLQSQRMYEILERVKHIELNLSEQGGGGGKARSRQSGGGHNLYVNERTHDLNEEWKKMSNAEKRQWNQLSLQIGGK